MRDSVFGPTVSGASLAAVIGIGLNLHRPADMPMLMLTVIALCTA